MKIPKKRNTQNTLKVKGDLIPVVLSIATGNLGSRIKQLHHAMNSFTNIHNLDKLLTKYEQKFYNNNLDLKLYLLIPIISYQ